MGFGDLTCNEVTSCGADLFDFEFQGVVFEVLRSYPMGFKVSAFLDLGIISKHFFGLVIFKLAELPVLPLLFAKYPYVDFLPVNLCLVLEKEGDKAAVGEVIHSFFL